MPKSVLFLMSDTGGGHRAAAEAIRDALYARYGAAVYVQPFVDVYKEMIYPLNRMPEWYPLWVNHGKTSWGLGYNFSNTERRAHLLSRGMYITNGHLLRRMVRQNPADVVVCVHSVVNRPSMSAFQSLERRPPFITVVTDLVSTHMFWYDYRVERCLVPTQAAYSRGLRCGLKPSQLRITGLPVHPSFSKSLQDKLTVRREMGLDADTPVILLVGGGAGMGSLYETTRAINAQHPDCQLLIVAGTNKNLENRLRACHWHQPTQIFGFINNMPRLMSAADILVTKAGPATISEACIAGLPMILNDAIPGQETGNVDFVVQNNAGVYAPSPQAVADHVMAWLGEGQEGLARRSAQARRMGRPNAVWDIAEEVWKQTERPLITTHSNGARRNLLDNLLDSPGEYFQSSTLT